MQYDCLKACPKAEALLLLQMRARRCAGLSGREVSVCCELCTSLYPAWVPAAEEGSTSERKEDIVPLHDPNPPAVQPLIVRLNPEGVLMKMFSFSGEHCCLASRLPRSLHQDSLLQPRSQAWRPPCIAAGQRSMENKGSELSPRKSSSGVTSCVQKKIDALRAGFEYVRPWGEDKFSPAFTDVSAHHSLGSLVAAGRDALIQTWTPSVPGTVSD